MSHALRDDTKDNTKVGLEDEIEGRLLLKSSLNKSFTLSFYRALTRS